jgi:Ca-activated chloride channel family protein
MKKFTFLLFLAGAFVRQVAASTPSDVTLRVTPERDLVYARGSREVIVQIDLDGRRPERGRRVPMNLALALDRSGSMQGAKIEKARQAVCLAVDHLADDDYFSLVTYNNETEIVFPPQRVGGAGNRAELKSRIERIGAGGGTALHAGVTLAARQVRAHADKEYLNRVILLSDGLANVGPSRTSDLAALGRELRQQSVSVTTIGVGDDYNEDLMTALAEASNANYYYVQDAEKLPGIFSEELGLARTLVARGVKIRISVPDGVRLQEIVGRPDISAGGREVEIRLPEYFGAEKRRFLARCLVDAVSTDRMEVAAVALNYESADGSGGAPQQQTAAVKFTDEERKADATIRLEVAREVSVTENRIAKERAVRLADEGKSKEAAEVLRSQAVANAAAPAAAQLPMLAEENRKLEAAAAELGTSGQFGKDSRKRMQYENWQDKYQKR